VERVEAAYFMPGGGHHLHQTSHRESRIVPPAEVTVSHWELFSVEGGKG